MSTKKIVALPVPCSHYAHKPPMHQVFRPGVYQHTCPACGMVTTFTVRGLG